MSNDDLSRKMEFIVEHQAQFAAHIQMLAERQERFQVQLEATSARQDRFDRQLEATSARQDRFERQLEAASARQDRFEGELETLTAVANTALETSTKTAEVVMTLAGALGAAQAETQRQISRVARLLEAHVREGHPPDISAT